jgi:parvulin-like peptidyl-prolyl isomerase
MKNILSFALCLLALGTVLARAASVEETVATVNGKPLLMSEYKKELNTVLEQYRRNAPQVLEDADKLVKIKKQVLDDMVDKALLYGEAESKKVKVYSRELESGIREVKERFRRDDEGKTLTDEELDAAFSGELKKQGLSNSQFEERIKRDLMIRKFVNEAVRPLVKPPEDKDIQAYFEKVKLAVDGDTASIKGQSNEEMAELMTLARQLRDLTSERVRARHVLIRVSRNATVSERNEALKKIQDVKKQLDSGTDFEVLAKKYSQDPESAAHGGDLGYVLHGMTVPEFEKAAFAMSVGQVSDIVETPFGYHIIRVDEKRAARKLIYDEVKDDLAQFMFGQRLQRRVEAKVKELRAAGTVETFLPKDEEMKKGAEASPEKSTEETKQPSDKSAAGAAKSK